MEAIVLAGGLGTRLRSLVADVPKPMASVRGRPFLERLLDYWIAQGVTRFLLSLGYLGERIRAHFGAAWRGAEISYVQEERALGTGGALLLALRQARGKDVLAINGDSYFAIDARELCAFHATHDAHWSVAVFRSSQTTRYLGMTLDPQGRITALGAQSAAQSLLVNGGVYLLRTASFSALPWSPGDAFSLESELMPYVLSSGWRLFAREFDAPFLDIGLPDDYLRAGAVLGS